MKHDLKFAVMVGLFLAMIAATFTLLLQSLYKTGSLTAVSKAPTYNIQYNYTKLVKPKIFVINQSRYIFLVYSHTHPFKSVGYVYEAAKIYDLPVLAYDIDNPWYGLKLSNNTTIPLVPLSFVPGVFCVNGNNVVYFYLRGAKLEDVLDFISKCVNNSK